jgi:hypothetical protein
MRRRLDRAAWRLQAAETERLWAIASASEQGQSVRKIAEAVGLSPTRVHQILKDADHEAIAEQISELREQGWPAVDSDGKDDGIADLIGERIADEPSALRDCARWLEALNNDTVVGLLDREYWGQVCNPNRGRVVEQPPQSGSLHRQTNRTDRQYCGWREGAKHSYRTRCRRPPMPRGPPGRGHQGRG